MISSFRWTICLLPLILLIGQAKCLRCYQNQHAYMSNTTHGSPTDCPMRSYSCIISVDYTQRITTRACQAANCTSPPGQLLSAGRQCFNSTGYPIQTFCCCYGDGCNDYPDPPAGNWQFSNSTDIKSPPPPVQARLPPPIVTRFPNQKCYQGQTAYKSNTSLSSAPAECPMSAWSCIISVDYSRMLVIRACQSTNCTMVSAGAQCVNSTTYPPQTYCCCNGDGCNGYPDPPAGNWQFSNSTSSNSPMQAVAMPQCPTRGVWGIWSDWSQCPSQVEKMFERLANINIQTRSRLCATTTAPGCKPVMCEGPHWENRPCGTAPVKQTATA